MDTKNLNREGIMRGTRQLPVSVALAFGMANALAAPIITTQPSNNSVSIGAVVTNRVTASGTAPLMFQWRKDQVEISGATNRTLALANIQISHDGVYSVVVADSTGSVTSRVARLEVDSTFTKITRGPVVTDGGLSVGVAWVDYDDDGYLDLLITNSSATKNFLYHNERNGTFQPITEGPIVNTLADFRAPAWADYDNDGQIDLYVASPGAYAKAITNNFLFRNMSGEFISMSSDVVGPLVGPNGPSESSHWADYDNDGFLDLFVMRYGTDMLFHNAGNGTFTGITNSPIVQAPGDNYGAAWSDYDNDGYPDLFVASATGNESDGLYHNNGDGTFRRITTGAIATDRATSSSPVWVDYDNNGWMDLFVGNDDRPNFLYRNNGDGTFTRMTTGTLVNTSASRSVWGDYDNDGFLDVFMPLRGGLNNILFHNRGDGIFERITSGSLVHDGGDSVNVSWGDYDNDGFLDLIVANGAGTAVENNFLYRNNGNNNGWLKVKLIGTVSNRSAIGAKIRINAPHGGTNMWQMRELTEGAGPNGSTLIPHFGLGNASNINTLRIEWPSGIVEEHHDLTPKQFLTFSEPPKVEWSSKSATKARIKVQGAIGTAYKLEASENFRFWVPVRTNILTTQSLEFEDADAGNLSHRFYRVSTLP